MRKNQKSSGDMKFEQYLRKAETISLAGHEILIWGAGNTAELNKGVIFEEGLCPDFFVDSDPAKQGSRLWDIEIIAPDDIKKHCENPLVFICSVQPKVCRAVKMQLMEMGIVTYHMLDEVVWGRHRKELMTVYQLLETDESKEYFASVIVSRIKGEEVSKINRKDMAYFGMEQFGTGNAEEIFVDCGAFEGDTVEQYVDVKKAVFKEIYAFEPDQRNWEAMQKRIGVLTQKWNLAQSRIHLLKGAAGKPRGGKSKGRWRGRNSACLCAGFCFEGQKYRLYQSRYRGLRNGYDRGCCRLHSKVQAAFGNMHLSPELGFV